jgi:hypothetical protein
MCYINEVGFIAATLLVISEIIKTRMDIKFAMFDIFENKGKNK